MKHLGRLVVVASLATMSCQSAQASLLAEAPPATDTMECLTLLLTDPDEHAAKCGGPFTMDEGTAPLVKGNYKKGCPLIGMTPSSLAGDEWSLKVAGPVTCCDTTFLMPAVVAPEMGEVFRFRVAC